MRGVPDDYYPDDLEPVPTVSELAKQGMAKVIERNKDGNVTIAVPTPEGQDLINTTMRRNAERMIAHHERRKHEAAQDDPRDQ